MGDSWEDDDFTPVLPQAVILPTKAAWEDEDLVSGDLCVVPFRFLKPAFGFVCLERALEDRIITV
jgi:hypothetical protein